MLSLWCFFSCQGAAINHFDSLSPHHLVIWTDGLFFLLAKETPAFLPAASFVALRSPFSILQAQGNQTFLLQLAPFCKLFVGLGSTDKTATSFRLLLYPCYAFFSFVIPRLHTLTYLAETPFFLLSGYNGSTVTHFFRRLTWPGLVRCSSHPLSHVSLSPLIFIVLFFRTGGILSTKFFETQVSSMFTKELPLARNTSSSFSSSLQHKQSFIVSRN